MVIGMKPTSVKTRMEALVKYYGSCDAVANVLDISTRYVRNMSEINKKTGKRFVPGKRLYRDICQLHTDLFGRTP